jgi:hypothetical protein
MQKEWRRHDGLGLVWLGLVREPELVVDVIGVMTPSGSSYGLHKRFSFRALAGGGRARDSFPMDRWIAWPEFARYPDGDHLAIDQNDDVSNILSKEKPSRCTSCDLGGGSHPGNSLLICGPRI